MTADIDARAGANIRAARKAKGMTQSRLADALTARGHPMVLSVVSKIETGDRPLGFAEAVILVDVLGISLDDLNRDVALAQARAEVEAAERALERARARLSAVAP